MRNPNRKSCFTCFGLLIDSAMPTIQSLISQLPRPGASTHFSSAPRLAGSQLSAIIASETSSLAAFYCDLYNCARGLYQETAKEKGCFN
jgi:hypothetical protein